MDASKPSTTERLLNFAMLAVGFGVAVGVFWREGGWRNYDRTPLLMLGTLLGTVGITLLVTYVGVAREHPPAGASLIMLLVGAPLALLAWKLGYSSLFEGATRWWPSKPGFKCLALSTVDGLAILAALLATRRVTRVVHPVAAGASTGVAAGALAWVLVDLWCPVGHVEHVLLGHVLPLVILTAVGAWPGGRWLQARAQRKHP